MYSNNGLPAHLLFPWCFSQGFGPPGGNFSSGSSPGQPSNPYDMPSNFGGRPPKKSNFWMYFFLIGGGLLIACCGCVGILGYIAAGKLKEAGTALINSALEEVGKQIIAKHKDDPVIQEHIGPVTKSSISFEGTIAEQQTTGKDGAIVIDIEGPKGKGKIIGIPPKGENPNNDALENAKLRLPDGREFPLSKPAAGGLGEMETPQETTEAMPAEQPAETEAKEGIEGFNGGS